MATTTKKSIAFKPLSSGPIKNVLVLYEHMREMIFNALNIWKIRYNTTTLYRMKLPGQVVVSIAGAGTKPMRYIVQRFLLHNTNLVIEDLKAPLSHTHLLNVEMSGKASHTQSTSNFPHILVLLKLRWLLKLHSAFCELEHKIISLKSMITGLHRLMIQECQDVAGDSGFKRKRVKQVLDVNSFLDDLIEQILRSFGLAFGGFSHFVTSCDPNKSINISKCDLSAPRVTSNSQLVEMIDDIFIAYFIKSTMHSNSLRDLWNDLEAFDIPPPDLYVLKLDQIKWWLDATTTVTQKTREKSAQHQLTRALPSLALEEIGEYRNVDVDNDLPTLTDEAMDILIRVLGHHQTFPHMYRERLFHLLHSEYYLTQAHSHRIGIAMTQDLDLPRLSAHQIEELRASEFTRLHKHTETYQDVDLMYTLPSTVAPPMHAKLAALYTKPTPIPPKPRARSVPCIEGENKFRVPLVTGPLVYDHERMMLRTTGYFVQMPNLGP